MPWHSLVMLNIMVIVLNTIEQSESNTFAAIHVEYSLTLTFQSLSVRMCIYSLLFEHECKLYVICTIWCFAAQKRINRHCILYITLKPVSHIANTKNHRRNSIRKKKQQEILMQMNGFHT